MIWRAGIASVATLTLVVGGCGEKSEEVTPAGEAADSYEITIGEFLRELQPQKQAILEDFVADSETCENVKVGPNLLLLVSAAAADADPDDPLTELVEREC